MIIKPRISLIWIIITVLLVSCLYAGTKKGRVERVFSGKMQNKYSVSCKFRGSDTLYGYSSPIKDSTYVMFQKQLRNAFYSEAPTTIEFDSTRKILSVIVHKIKMVPRKNPRPKFIKSWKRPESKDKAYNVGDSVIIGGRFISLIDKNMWSPREAPNFWKLKEGSKLAARVWEKPEGAHDCYNKGARVIFDGDDYESLIDGNIWSPIENRYGWKYVFYGPESMIDSSKLVSHEFVPVNSRLKVSTFRKPTGAHDAYKRGDMVSLDGITYRSIIDANVWSPAVARSYWEIVSGTRRTAAWKKPAGIHDCYHKGHKVTYNGKTYESLMNSNVWSPEELSSSWKRMK